MKITPVCLGLVLAVSVSAASGADHQSETNEVIAEAKGLIAFVMEHMSKGGMYHHTDADEKELLASSEDYNAAQREYQSLVSSYTPISFTVLNAYDDGCHIELFNRNDYFLYGQKGAKNRRYSGVWVKDSGDHDIQLNPLKPEDKRTLPTFTVCSAQELADLKSKRDLAAEAHLKYSKLDKLKKTKLTNERVLQANIESAKKGESYGLRRMSERSDKGDGVETNAVIADKFLKLSEKAEKLERDRIEAKGQLEEEAAAKQQFQKALKGADAGDYQCAINVARLYRDGIGTEQDLPKALEYFKKAQKLKPAYDPYKGAASNSSIQSEIDEIEKKLHH